MLPENVRKFRLGLVTPSRTMPDPADGRSLSRYFGPFNLMRRQDPRLELVTPMVKPGEQFAEADWDFIGGMDAVLLVDPFTERDLRVCGLARACETRVWVDYIDDLCNVPPSNPKYEAFIGGAQQREMMGRIIAAADVATCTTATLKARLPWSSKVRVLPEGCRWPTCPRPRERVVTWRGAGGHAEDLDLILPALREVGHMPQFSQWTWAFLGKEKPDWRVAKCFPRPNEQLLFIPWLPPFDFINQWGNQAPFLHLAPLVDSAFNRAKTPLVWLEATAIGAAVIGPDLPEWRNCPGLIHYGEPDGIGEILKRELFKYEGGKLHPAAIESRSAVYPARTTPVINAQRWAILKELCEANAKMD